MPAATAWFAVVFAVTRTRSTGPIRAGSSLASTSTVKRSSGVSSVSPFARMAAKWSPRAITATSRPALASRAAR